MAQIWPPLAVQATHICMALVASRPTDINTVQGTAQTTDIHMTPSDHTDHSCMAPSGSTAHGLQYGLWCQHVPWTLAWATDTVIALDGSTGH
ncbi:hypothetical protein STEG23_021003 [Scotinomys teguina]